MLPVLVENVTVALVEEATPSSDGVKVCAPDAYVHPLLQTVVAKLVPLRDSEYGEPLFGSLPDAGTTATVTVLDAVQLPVEETEIVSPLTR